MWETGLRESKNIIKKTMAFNTRRIIGRTHRGPPQVLYNAIYATVEGTCKHNSYGYFITDSLLEATKIWSLASD